MIAFVVVNTQKHLRSAKHQKYLQYQKYQIIINCLNVIKALDKHYNANYVYKIKLHNFLDQSIDLIQFLVLLIHFVLILIRCRVCIDINHFNRLNFIFFDELF
jgi:hypothetical protein